jgi:hypothetical protein
LHAIKLKMEISNKNMVFIVLVIGGYLYLSDIFNKPNFQINLREALNKTMGNSTSHSLVEWIETKTNTIAGIISVTSVTILNQFPVSLDLHKEN